MVGLKQRLPFVSRYVVLPDGMRHDEEFVNGEAYPRDNGGENAKEKGAEAKAVIRVLESCLGYDAKAEAIVIHTHLSQTSGVMVSSSGPGQTSLVNQLIGKLSLAKR